MKRAHDSREADARTLAELSALADGTLDPKREEAVRTRIASSPELMRLYERERQAVTALRALRADRAPARLRLTRASARRRVGPRPRARLLYGGALAAAIAVALAAIVLVLPGGAPGSPSVSQAAALSLRGAALPAPSPDPAQPGTKLAQDVQEVYFPNWSGWFGWRAVGRRFDVFDRRQAVTVYYQRAGRQIAYTILASPPLAWPGANTRRVNGVRIESFSSDGRLVVTWRRRGHTCVLSGRGISVAELSGLAAWRMPGASE